MIDISEEYTPCPMKGWCVMCRRLEVRQLEDDVDFWCPKMGIHASPSNLMEDCDGFVYEMDDKRECRNCKHFRADKYCDYNSWCIKNRKFVASQDYVCEDYEDRGNTDV